MHITWHCMTVSETVMHIHSQFIITQSVSSSLHSQLIILHSHAYYTVSHTVMHDTGIHTIMSCILHA